MTTAAHECGRDARPLLGIRRQPGRLALALMRMPRPLYHRGWGWMLDHTFLLIAHQGRNTGKRHETVAMTLTYDPDTREAVVCSAWGANTEWIRNLRAHPALQIQIGRETYVPEQRFLSEHESIAVAMEFRRRHPWRSRFLAAILGWGDLRSDTAVREFVRSRPFVSFRLRFALADARRRDRGADAACASDGLRDPPLRPRNRRVRREPGRRRPVGSPARPCRRAHAVRRLPRRADPGRRPGRWRSGVPGRGPLSRVRRSDARGSPGTGSSRDRRRAPDGARLSMARTPTRGGARTRHARRGRLARSGQDDRLDARLDGDRQRPSGAVLCAGRPHVSRAGHPGCIAPDARRAGPSFDHVGEGVGLPSASPVLRAHACARERGSSRRPLDGPRKVAHRPGVVRDRPADRRRRAGASHRRGGRAGAWVPECRGGRPDGPRRPRSSSRPARRGAAGDRRARSQPGPWTPGALSRGRCADPCSAAGATLAREVLVAAGDRFGFPATGIRSRPDAGL